jgi:hypothetical protein
MNVKFLIERLQEFPEDYDVYLGGHIKVKLDEGEEQDPAVINYPIIGLASNEEKKELRFVIEHTDFDALKLLGDKFNEL